jgi:SAM-dependent methyltransferase
MHDDGGQTWAEIAAWYDQMISRGSGPHETAVSCLLGLLPAVASARVLDVACGQGLATRALLHAGAASVVGVDSSREMIEIAATRTEPMAPISYVVDDAQRLSTCADESFDGVTCQLALMDIPDLIATLSSVYRVLKPGGWFVFVIGHPCFLAPEATTEIGAGGRPARLVNAYLDERFWRSSNPHGVRRAGQDHRPLATYLNSLTAIGFRVEAVDEPRASPLLATEQPVYTEVPIFFGARARRVT